MNWSRLFAPEPGSRWIVAMAGHEVFLSLRMALPGRWYRVLPARDCAELEQRVSIIVPEMVVVEIPTFEPDLLLRLRDFHRRHPLIPWIAVLDTANRDLMPILREHGACKALIKPLDHRTVMREVGTEAADA